MDLRHDPIPALIRKIALPASLGMLFSVLMGVVDTFYAGMLSATALAALSLAGPVFFLVITVGIGVGQATNALVGNELGADRPEHAQRLAFQSISFASIITVLGSILALWQLPALFALMGGEDPYLEPATSYMSVVLVGSALYSLAVVFNSVLNTRGDTRSYRNAQFVGVLANIVLDPLFMFTFGLGVTGVAIATILIQLGVVAYLYGKVVKLDFMRSPTVSDLIPEPKLFLAIAKQSVPITLSMMLVAVGSIIIVAYVSHYGEAAMAAYGIALRIEQIILLPVIGINIAALSLTGVNYGAKLITRVKSTYSTGVTYAVTLMVLGAIPLVFFGETLMQIFTDDASVVEIGTNYLLIEALILPAYAVTFLSNAVLQGLKQPMYALYCNIFRQVVLQLLFFYLVVDVFDMDIINLWLAVFAANWIMTFVIFYLHTRCMRKVEFDLSRATDVELTA